MRLEPLLQSRALHRGQRKAGRDEDDEERDERHHLRPEDALVEDAGQQAGRLANRIIHERVDPGALAVAQPEGLDLSFNLTVARKSGPSCDAALELLRFAARRDFAVKVYE